MAAHAPAQVSAENALLEALSVLLLAVALLAISSSLVLLRALLRFLVLTKLGLESFRVPGDYLLFRFLN